MWGGYVCGDCKLFCSHSPSQEEIFESPLQIISECCDFMAREKKNAARAPPTTPTTTLATTPTTLPTALL